MQMAFCGQLAATYNQKIKIV